MQFYSDSKKADEIRDRLIELFDSQYGPRDEVHLSDTCYCPMKCYNRLDGMKPLRTKTTKGFMIVGNVVQYVVQQIYPPEQREYESTDIVYSHVDVYEDFQFPLEIKGSARKIFKAADVPPVWRLQLMRYMAKHNAEVGWMIILNLFSRQLHAFKMVMTPDDRWEQIEEMLKFKMDIQKSREEEDPYLLEIHEDKCSKCDYKPSKKRRDSSLGKGCVRYVRKRKKKA